MLPIDGALFQVMLPTCPVSIQFGFVTVLRTLWMSVLVSVV